MRQQQKQKVPSPEQGCECTFEGTKSTNSICQNGTQAQAVVYY